LQDGYRGHGGLFLYPHLSMWPIAYGTPKMPNYEKMWGELREILITAMNGLAIKFMSYHRTRNHLSMASTKQEISILGYAIRKMTRLEKEGIDG
jgi:hypothetical protein